MAVVIYTIPSCEWSNKAKKYLKDNNISFEEKDLTEDKLARKEIVDISGQIGTPVIKIWQKVIIGFNSEEIKKAVTAQ